MPYEWVSQEERLAALLRAVERQEQLHAAHMQQQQQRRWLLQRPTWEKNMATSERLPFRATRGDRGQITRKMARGSPRKSMGTRALSLVSLPLLIPGTCCEVLLWNMVYLYTVLYK